MSETKACPFCGEQILAVAIKCKHCKSDLPSTPVKARPAPQQPQKWVKIVLIATGIYLLWKFLKFILRNFVPYYWKD